MSGPADEARRLARAALVVSLGASPLETPEVLRRMDRFATPPTSLACIEAARKHLADVRKPPVPGPPPAAAFEPAAPVAPRLTTATLEQFHLELDVERNAADVPYATGAVRCGECNKVIAGVEVDQLALDLLFTAALEHSCVPVAQPPVAAEDVAPAVRHLQPVRDAETDVDVKTPSPTVWVSIPHGFLGRPTVRVLFADTGYSYHGFITWDTTGEVSVSVPREGRFKVLITSEEGAGVQRTIRGGVLQ